MTNEYLFTNSWFDESTTKSWTHLLSVYKDKENINYLEVGVFEGRSFFWALDNILTHPTSRATAVDIFPPGYEAIFKSNIEKSGHSEKLEIQSGRSEFVLPKMAPNSYDIIYIDGGHNVRSVLIDAIHAWPLLKLGGMLIFDDYLLHRDRFPANLRPKHALDTFIMGFIDELEIIQKSYQLVLKKIRNPDYTHLSDARTKFGTYSYEWAARKITTPSHSVLLEATQSAPLEKLLREFEESRIEGSGQNIEKMAVQLVHSLIF